MSKRDLLLTLPFGALKEVADWLEPTHDRFRDRSGWVKAVYADELARTLSVQDTAALVREIMTDAGLFFSESVLIRLFGLPPKADMLNCTRAELRELVQKLEDQGRVDTSWRSWSAGDLRDYLMRKLTAREVAELIGLDLPNKRTNDALVEPPKPHRASPRSASTSDAPETPPRRVTMPIEAAVLPAHHAGVATQVASSPRIETLEELRRYLVRDFQYELEAIADLGGNEGRFQHKIVSALESRISHEPFYIDEKQHLSDLDQFPDVMIRHARGDTAFEIKRAGNLKALLKDAQKLKGYLRLKKNPRVTFGVLIYSSPFAVPDELARAMRSDQLHLIRVHPPKSR